MYPNSELKSSSVTTLTEPPVCVSRCDGEHRIMNGNDNFNFIACYCVTFEGRQAMVKVSFDC